MVHSIQKLTSLLLILSGLESIDQRISFLTFEWTRQFISILIIYIYINSVLIYFLSNYLDCMLNRIKTEQNPLNYRIFFILSILVDSIPEV